MSTDLATRQYEPLPEAVENLLAHGDLKQLNTAQRISYYKARCDAAGLDPRGRPFEFIQLNGKLVLYALKECAEQLNGLHGISHSISGITFDEKTQLIEVTVQASTKSGRTTFDIGVVNAQGLKGDALANAKMKAVTKAKRRATLSLCGLGDVVDESELDTVSTVRVSESGNAIAADNGTGAGSGKYASKEQVDSYLAAMEGYLAKRTAKWIDYWQGTYGEIPEACGDLCNRWQADGHLAKWAQETGRLVEGSLPEDGKIKNNQVGRFTAIIYHRSKADQKALATELASYLDRQEQIQMDRIKAKNPDLFATEDEPTDDEVMGDAFDEADGKHKAIEGATS